MSDLEAVRDELGALGIESHIVEFPEFPPSPKAVVFEFRAPTGRHKGRLCEVGVGFQEAGYPEYPPHFIHVRGEKLLGGTPYATHSREGETWHAYSRPPSDIWDSGAYPRTMRTFVEVHMRRVWHNP